MNITELSELFHRLSERKEQLGKEIERDTQELSTIRKRRDLEEQARWVLNEVQAITQNNFKSKVESLVTMAIQSIFERPFEFKLLFEQKANKFSITPVVVEGQAEYYPKHDMGGGILDVIGFAFRIVLWSLQQPRTRPVIVLDEPFRFVGKALIAKAGNVIKQLSDKLGLQFIINTHETELAEIADRAFYLVHNGQHTEIISE